MSERPFTNRDFQQLASLRYALRQFVRSSELAARRVGLTPRQHQALLAVRGAPEDRAATVGHVAEWLQIRHHSAVGLLDRLEEKGFVVRRPGVEDRRQVFISVTDAGNQILDKLAHTHREELRRIGPQLLATLEDLLG